jgi:hypothetical protein
MPNAGPQGPIGGREAIVMDLEELRKVPVDDLPEGRVPWLAALINLLRSGRDGAGTTLGDRFDRCR